MPGTVVFLRSRRCLLDGHSPFGFNFGCISRESFDDYTR